MGNKLGRAEENTSNTKLSFEAELHLLAKTYEYVSCKQEENGHIISVEDLLVAFYKEAEKLRLKVNANSK